MASKWDAVDDAKAAVAHYTWYPFLSLDGCLRRLAAIYDGHEDRIPLELAEDVVRLAASRIDSVQDSFIYVEVDEGTNPRRSFDVNFYQGEIPLWEMFPLVSRIRQHYGIPDEPFNSFYGRIRTNVAGHLSGGIDRKGQDYLATYYDISDK